MPKRVEAACALEARLGYSFRDPALLETALTHASVGEGARKVLDNERLEFLGDRVLGLLTAERLMAFDAQAREGELAQRFNALVSRTACALVGRRMELGPALRLSGAETRSGGREKETIVADAVEAVMAAVYLDGGLQAARAVHQAFWGEDLEAVSTPRNKDPKTALQEWAQARGRPLPIYAVVGREGPDHAPRFTVEARVEGCEPVQGVGPSRQAAEKGAAEALLVKEGAP